MSSLMETFERRLAPNLLAEPPEEKEIRFNTSENRMHRVWRAYDWGNATHKKASQNTPGFVAGVAGWLAYYVLQYPFVARRASDVH